MENDENQTSLNESLSKGNEESVRKSKRLTIVPNKFVGKSGKKSQKEPVEWKLGDQCEACDQSKNWFKCKIIQMDETRVKIHFCGWNSRYDKWIDKNSDEIRPEKKTKSKSDNNLDELEKNHEKIPNGTFVMSKWIDEAYYPAKVIRFLIKNEMPYYEVKFLDGVRKTIKFSNLRMPNEDELGLFDQTESEKPENLIKEDDQQRRAEAELLLAIQEPVLKLNESPKQDENKEALSENKIEEKNVENPEVTSINSEAKTEEKDVKIEENENIAEQGNIRKSLRVKRLRTFTEEIVFDSPASSISYNLASMRREKSPEVVVKKKKVDDKPTEEEKEENRRKVQNYFKSLKLFKSKKMPHHETKKSEIDDENDDEERKQRKKLKKDKRKLFEELIRNSKIQLEKQQKLIAQQLEEHTLKKSQKKLEKILKKQTNKQIEIYSSDTSINNNLENIEKVNNDVISCTIQNCTKTFRKQSLLDYHLKYHHYVDSNKPETTKTPSKKTKPKKVKLDETNEYSYGHSLKSDDETDPYEVIHCKCSNNVNKGFMIQCEICLCWQHGVCERILSNSQVPESYLCWICNEPTNNLKNLKYQSWLKTRMENELKLKSEHAQDNEEINRIKLLNECSKQYYGLNLLMYTLEFQMSIFNQLLSKSHKCEMDQMDQSVDNNNNNNNNEIEHDDENYEQLDKLSQNIAHLQECLSKQFNEFNSKLDEYETMYPMDENLEMQNFNLEQLYSQLQSIL